MPVEWYVDTTAPTGLVFCDGCGLTGSEDNLFFGEYNTGRIREGALTTNRDDFVSSPAIAYDHPEGVLSLEQGPDGTIYFSDDDSILKLVNA
jgi:glucose/arabinose dehydrogenase